MPPAALSPFNPRMLYWLKIERFALPPLTPPSPRVTDSSVFLGFLSAATVASVFVAVSPVVWAWAGTNAAHTARAMTVRWKWKLGSVFVIIALPCSAHQQLRRRVGRRRVVGAMHLRVAVHAAAALPHVDDVLAAGVAGDRRRAARAPGGNTPGWPPTAPTPPATCGVWHCWHSIGGRDLSMAATVLPCGLWQIAQSSATGSCCCTNGPRFSAWQV